MTSRPRPTVWFWAYLAVFATLGYLGFGVYRAACELRDDLSAHRSVRP